MKWKEKDIKFNYDKIMSYGFIAILGVVFLCSFHPDRTFSEAENRNLHTIPALSIENFWNHQYQKEFMSYKNDQFIGRDNWIQIKTKLDIMMGKKKFQNIYLGNDDQLFEEFDPMIDTEKLGQLLSEFAAEYPKLKTTMMVVPNPISIWKDRLPAMAPVKDQQLYLEQLHTACGKDINWIDVYQVLDEHKEEQLYYKSDHHWTTLAAYYAFQKFANDNSIKIKEDDWTPSLISDSFYGSLSGKSGYIGYELDKIYAYLPTDTSLQYTVQYIHEQKKTTSVYASDKLQGKDQYAVFLNGNHPLIEIDTTSKEDKRLLIIKDSYANSMIPFLLPYYSKITVVDPRYYNDDINSLIKGNNITDILFLYNANTLFQDTSLSLLLGA